MKPKVDIWVRLKPEFSLDTGEAKIEIINKWTDDYTVVLSDDLFHTEIGKSRHFYVDQLEIILPMDEQLVQDISTGNILSAWTSHDMYSRTISLKIGNNFVDWKFYKNTVWRDVYNYNMVRIDTRGWDKD